VTGGVVKCAIDPSTECALGSPLIWPRACVSYSMQYQASKQVDLENATAVAAKAFAAWEQVTCPGGGSPSIHLSNAFGPVACKMQEYNKLDGNANVVLFHDNEWPYTADEDALALTTVSFNAKSGDIYDADVEVNGLRTLSIDLAVDPRGFDLRSILTHEAGHFLGLAHSQSADATMWRYYEPGSIDLDQDDIDAICAVYPPTEERSVCDFSPRQGFSPECGIYPSTVSCAMSPVFTVRATRQREPFLLLGGLACVHVLRRARRAKRESRIATRS
jgi:hypothetical protein